MTEGTSLINIGELAKPATVLIEKVCGAIGIVYEPTRIKRKAAADAGAELMLAAARIEISEIQRRAVERLIVHEGKKQENIEKITHDAAVTMAESAEPEKLDDDWLVHFFDQCSGVSDSDMQALWSKLLATEARAPGKISKRTVNLVATLEKTDAALFTSLCQFVWNFNEPTAVIFDPNVVIYESAGISFAALKHLDSLGLISFEPASGYVRKGDAKRLVATYLDTTIVFEFPLEKDNRLDLGKVLLTSAGMQLVPLTTATRNDVYLQHAIEHWKTVGANVQVTPSGPVANSFAGAYTPRI